jgi:quercetin dioxygenase-like cupin family protein
VLGSLAAAPAAEFDAKAVQIKTPDQFKWRDPSMRAPNNAVLLGDAAVAGSLFVHINSFVPGKFGEAHYHPNDRYVLVVDGAPWRGTGNVVDPAHAIRVPKGTFMTEEAGKVHWDGTKDEGGAYFIIEIPPSGQTPAPKEPGPWHGGDPSASKITAPNEYPWQGARHNERALLAGDPSKPGVYVMMSRWSKGSFSHPHFHSADRYVYVVDGTWWVGTGNKFDPEHLAVPVKAGSFATEAGKEVHWAGARDEDATILIFGQGPISNTEVEEAK